MSIKQISIIIKYLCSIKHNQALRYKDYISKGYNTSKESYKLYSHYKAILRVFCNEFIYTNPINYYQDKSIKEVGIRVINSISLYP
jgi:hypothetical protein